MPWEPVSPLWLLPVQEAFITFIAARPTRFLSMCVKWIKNRSWFGSRSKSLPVQTCNGAPNYVEASCAYFVACPRLTWTVAPGKFWCLTSFLKLLTCVPLFKMHFFWKLETVGSYTALHERWTPLRSNLLRLPLAMQLVKRDSGRHLPLENTAVTF